MAIPYKILVKYASRGRVDHFFEGLNNIYQMCSSPDNIRVLVTADLDDPTMCNKQVRDKINCYKNAMVIYGTSNNKIHACSRDLDILPKDFADWQILANFSDDMRWTMPGWDEYIRADFEQVFPDLSGFMAYRDPDTFGALSTLAIMGREWFDMWGFVYDTQFVSLFCDNLLENVAKHLGRYHYTGYDIYRHHNPSYGYHAPDEMYLEQQRIGWDVDQKLYYHIINEVGLDNYIIQKLNKK